MNALVEKALTLWGMGGASYQLAAARENHVFRVEHQNQTYALRLHRQGYRTDRELLSELQWMDACGKGGIGVPTPIASLNNSHLQRVNGTQVSLLTWLDGEPMGKTGEPLETSHRTELFRTLGEQMARLHSISDQWTPPPDFQRVSWNRDGLLGNAPVWGRFWENPTLSIEDRNLFETIREAAKRDLARIENNLDCGLIHADLVRENVLVDGDTLNFIDFDDGGYGFRLFDVATTLLKNIGEDDFPALETAFIEGYVSLRQIDFAQLDLFLLLRSATYVGWIMPRMDEASADMRNARFIEQTRKLAEKYLAD